MSSVGAINPGGPRGTALPSPQSTWPVGPAGNNGPNWYVARRPMAGPAMTFSPTVSCKKPTGAMTRHFPASTSACVVTPRTPPKWSACEWV